MRTLIGVLSRSPIIRRLVQLLHLHRIANAYLRRFPAIKTLKDSRVKYRATRIESIPLATEMFEQHALYDASLLPRNFTTFVDLGCNVGYFTCWLLHLAAGRKLSGLMIDANLEAVNEARWHATANGCPEIFGYHGIVGEGKAGGTADFYLYESNICSTSHQPDPNSTHLKGKWTHVKVPALNIETLWRSHFGHQRCHILKIDIEGSELTFLEAERTFLDLVDSILIEWHKWRVTLDQVNTLLSSAGFKHAKTLDENSEMGTAYFVRA